MRRSILAAPTWVAAARVLAGVVSISWFASAGSADEPVPAPGDYVQVEEMPEAIHKVPPVYPPAARAAGVAGTVIVTALVARDGTVRETRITQSVPMLDAAATDAVKQWRFQPAKLGGVPVAVWVAVPVQFRLAEKPGGSDAPPAADSGARHGLAPERLRGIPVQPLFGGRYFTGADSSDLVIVTRRKGGRLRLESPGEWTGAGTVQGDAYRGTFVYGRGARDPRNRGARGTHAGTLRPDGSAFVEGTFTNREWPPFRVTWTPLDAGLRFRGSRPPHTTR